MKSQSTFFLNTLFIETLHLQDGRSRLPGGRVRGGGGGGCKCSTTPRETEASEQPENPELDGGIEAQAD